MRRGATRGLVMFALAAVLGCGSGPSPKAAAPGRSPALRVGLSPDSPPMAFAREGQLTGVEPDLARALGSELGRPVTFVPLDWDALIRALLDRRIDIIMSGMTVTPARQVRVDFTTPYMRSGMMAAARRGDVGRWASAEAMETSAAHVGVKAGTTAERFVREHFRLASVSAYPDLESAARELAQNRLDLIVSDIPLVLWAVSANEADLAIVRVRLTRDDLAWAVRRDDPALRQAADAALARLRADGRLQAILQRWIPYLPQLENLR